MKRILTFLVAFISVVSLHAQGDLHMFAVDNKDGKVNANMVEDAFNKAGFAIGINSHISEGLEKKYKHTDFTIYNAISVYHKKHTLDVMKKTENMGVFAPMGVSIFQRKGEDTLYISVLTSETQAKIMGIDSKILKDLEHVVTDTIMKVVPTAKHLYSEDSLEEKRDLITKFEHQLNGSDWEEAKEGIEEGIEDNLERFGFVMPSYFDFSEELGEESPYDFMVTYSICKIDVINAVSKVRPEAAAFAPCTTMVYKKKDEDKIVVGFTSVYNWLSSAAIKDKEARNQLMRAQYDFETILKTAIR